MRKSNFWILLTCLFLTIPCVGQQLKNYKMKISKVHQDAFNLHFDCDFLLVNEHQTTDSICLDFGSKWSSLKKMVVEDSTFVLKGTNLRKYSYNDERKSLVLYPLTKDDLQIKMHYVYVNMNAFFIFGKGIDEIWQTFGEFYYPCLLNKKCDLEVDVVVPDHLFFICSYPTALQQANHYKMKVKNVLSRSLYFAFLPKDKYIKESVFLPEEMCAYEIREDRCSKERFNELINLTKACIAFYQKALGSPYLDKEDGITRLPTFVFHDGEGSYNCYNMNYISASQHKFSTRENIYPLAHEIGHRWLGEFMLLCQDGSEGAYFIKESLNEFMSMMFVHSFYGEKVYEDEMQKKRKKYESIKGTKEDQPLIEMRENNNFVVVYSKGTLLLDRVAKQVGYDAFFKVIAKFYQRYKNKPNLHYADFITVFSEFYPEIAKTFDDEVRHL